MGKSFIRQLSTIAYVLDLSFQIIHVTINQKIIIQVPVIQIITAHNSNFSTDVTRISRMSGRSLQTF
jgi:hypothetical protein